MGKRRLKRKGPYKHSVNSTYLEPNLIYRRLRLDEVFRDKDVCVEFPELYETDRMPPTASSGEYASWMNERYRREYTDNLFYSRRSSRRETVSTKFRTAYSEIIRDPAHVSLFYAMWQRLTASARARRRVSAELWERFFIVQGGLGTGKTAMLRFFQRYVLGRSLQIEFPEKRPCSVNVDFQEGFVPTQELDAAEVYRRIIEELLPVLAEVGAKPTDFDFLGQNLALPDELRSDDFLGLLDEWVPVSNEQQRQLKAFTWHWIRRLTRSFGYVLLVVFDNADCHTQENQLHVFGLMNELLNRCREAFGVVSLREYTLNDLGQLRGAAAYYQLKTLHLTTPSIVGILKRRFARTADLLDREPPAPIPLHALGMAFTLRMSSYREFLDKWAGCFLSEPEVRQWLHYLTNCNVRHIMRIVRSLVGSAKVNVLRTVSDFYTNVKLYDETKCGKPWTRHVSADEFVRLLMLGNTHESTSSMYRDTAESLVQNLLDFNQEVPAGPHSQSGRFPVLVKYRALVYLGSAQRRQRETFLEHFSVYGYTREELGELLQWFLDYYFVESKEGINVNGVKWVMATRKLGFYLHKLTKFVIYQENIRNDTYISYECKPHEYGAGLLEDIVALCAFYREIMRYEVSEYAYMNGRGIHLRYAVLVGRQPICWRLLKGTRNRVMQLRRSIGKSLEAEKRQTLVMEVNRLRSDILGRCRRGELFPRMSRETIQRFRPLRLADFRPKVGRG